MTETSLEYSAFFIPAAIMGNYLGIKLSSKMSDGTYRKIVLVLVGISGLSCVIF